jgi:membrane protease YdiL (CAAX protease family)
MGQPSEVMQTVLGAVQGASGLGLVGLILALALVPAVVEETLFRGAITACFARSRLEAILVPSLLFGAFHLEPQQAAATAVLGVAFGLGRLYTGSLLPPMFAHAFYNMAVILLMRYVGASAEPHVAWQLVVGGAVVFTIGLWLLRGGEPRHKLELGAG